MKYIECHFDILRNCLYNGEIVADIAKSSVSDLGAYAQMAILGSAVGIINGVTGSIPIVGQGLLVRPAVAFADGAMTSIVDQLVRTGKLDGSLMLRDGAMSALADTLLRLGSGLFDELDDVLPTRVVDEDIINDANTGGAFRASQYSTGWENASAKDAVNAIAPDVAPVVTDTGKIIYLNPDTGMQVVYDIEGHYFRIENTNLQGRRVYTDVNGDVVPNNKIVDGKQTGINQGEYNQITHFNNIDTDFPYDR